MAKQKDKPNSLNYFIGGVPAGSIFILHVKEIKKILEEHDWEKYYKQTRVELCFIGLTAYFEAFFKDHFASLINIYPQLVNNLKAKNLDVGVEFSDILKYNINSPNKYGFLLSEKYDFGTAKKINSIYSSLLNISPFSKDEIEDYDFVMNNRNLIVHHGGIYTTKYSEQEFKEDNINERVFYDSLIISKQLMYEYIKYCEEIVKKTMKTTQRKLREIIKKDNAKLTRETRRAISFLYDEI